MIHTVLVVDDDESILKCIELMLRDHFKVVTASSGRAALDVLETDKVECIVSDYQMEDGDGLFLLRNLKQDIPFILMTGLGEKSLFKTFANEKATYIYEKPIMIDLLGIVRDSVEKHQRVKQQLKESLIGKSAGHILHDLSNDLNIIKGSAKAGLAKPAAETTQYLQMSFDACQRIETLISKYRLLIKDSKAFELSTININTFLMALVHECAISVGPEIVIEFECLPSRNLEIVGDPDLLRQILLNLISNSIYAIKESPSPSIKIRFFTDMNSSLIEIEDSGSISEEVAVNLFKEGFSTKGDNGTGMGLCYCKKTLSVMNAQIALKKHAPTTFSITFDS